MIKTKIMVTIGPACSSTQAIAELIDSGADILRINFSHGNPAQHLQFLQSARSAAAGCDSSVSVVGDLCGPKIRLADFADPPRTVKPSQQLVITSTYDPDDPAALATTYPTLVDDICVGQRLLINDGSIITEVVAKASESFTCVCRSAGLVYPGQGVNLPDTVISSPSLTAKDLVDLDWAVANQLDFVALSFVRHSDDLIAARDRLRAAESNIKLIAKIEKPQALDDLDAIIAHADGLLVARGDLGVEIDLARVPLVQKDIIRRCQLAGKPVIVATQMLSSMISSQTPTRAEVSDVANAIFDQADAVMLSGETAIGDYPALAVQTVDHIAQVSEKFQDTHASVVPALDLDLLPRSQAALARGVHKIATEARCSLVAVWSQSGAIAGLLSKTRIGVPIIALSSDPAVCRRMSLDYGVIPWRMDLPKDSADLLPALDKLIQDNNWAKSGDNIVVVTGHPLGTVAATDTIQLYCLGYTNLAPKPNHNS
ncbi:MAG: pyruvate kinase [Actinobacteria bacterium]|nr:pyruvate kinase [Actinomycetota bacterium]